MLLYKLQFYSQTMEQCMLYQYTKFGVCVRLVT